MAVEDKAILETESHIVLTENEFDRVIESLDTDWEPSEAFLKGVERYRNLSESDQQILREAIDNPGKSVDSLRELLSAPRNIRRDCPLW